MIRITSMGRVLTLVLALFVLILSGTGDILAASAGGQTAADFLQIGLGARSAGMGGAFTAVAEGASAAFWNPARLGSVEAGEVLLGHYAWYQDVTVDHGAVAYRLNEELTSAVSVTFLDYGRIEGFDALGNSTGDLTAYDLAASVSVGYEANDEISLGFTGKLVNQKLDDISASTIAFDMGIHYDAGRYSLAGVLANIGGKMNFDPIEEDLPMTMRLGGSMFLLSNSVRSSMDFEKVFNGGTVVRQGVEYNRNQQYFVRAGYNFYPEDGDRPFSTGLTFGAGMRLNQIEFDYAFTLKERYAADELHRFSLAFAFGTLD
ncbi:MAG: PorV/PorQ family protein [bacterium]|nr:PorV/PorQ family protein [bacterium]